MINIKFIRTELQIVWILTFKPIRKYILLIFNQF
jgi:hypothetical protein